MAKGRPDDGIEGKRGTRVPSSSTAVWEKTCILILEMCFVLFFYVQAYVTNGFSLKGLLNHRGSKVRLTFKMDEEQLQIATLGLFFSSSFLLSALSADGILYF